MTSPVRRSSFVALTGGSSWPGTPVPSGREPFGCVADGSPLRTRPSTLPTPSHVTPPSDSETKARGMAAPRVPFKASWQRWTSSARSWAGLRRTTSAAVRAARAASSPCPRPSIPATSTPSGSRVTTARSPLVASPRRHLMAMPHSTGSRAARSRTPTALLAQARKLVAEPPLRHRHRRAAVGARVDLEVVHEPPRPRQAEAEAAPCAVLVADGRLDVTDARPLVPGDHHDPVAAALLEWLEDDLAAA